MNYRVLFYMEYDLVIQKIVLSASREIFTEEK